MIAPGRHVEIIAECVPLTGNKTIEGQIAQCTRLQRHAARCGIKIIRETRELLMKELSELKDMHEDLHSMVTEFKQIKKTPQGLFYLQHDD